MTSPYARIWLVAAQGGEAPEARLPQGLAPLATVSGAAPAASGGEAELRACLAKLAAAHAGANVLWVGAPELLSRCAALVVGTAARALAARTLTIDWPVGEGIPLLVGVDLDWLPPIPLHRARFPGGPGAASSVRA